MEGEPERKKESETRAKLHGNRECLKRLNHWITHGNLPKLRTLITFNKLNLYRQTNRRAMRCNQLEELYMSAVIEIDRKIHTCDSAVEHAQRL